MNRDRKGAASSLISKQRFRKHATHIFVQTLFQAWSTRRSLTVAVHLPSQRAQEVQQILLRLDRQCRETTRSLDSLPNPATSARQSLGPNRSRDHRARRTGAGPI